MLGCERDRQPLTVDDTRYGLLLAMLDTNFRPDSAANVKISLHFDEAWIERGNEVVGDAIRHGLVERAFIAK